MKIVNLYFCHSPICAQLALSYSESIGDAERHVFITARSTPLTNAFFHITNDQINTKRELLSYVDSISAFIAGLCGGDEHLRVFIPHMASAALRLLACHVRIDSIYFLEEGSLYYRADLDHVKFSNMNYIKLVGLTSQEIVSIARRLGRRSVESEMIVWALCGDFQHFDYFGGRISGALVSENSVFSSISYRKNINIIICPLSPLYYPELESMAIYMPTAHHTLVSTYGVSFDDIVKCNKEKISAALNFYSKIVLKPHPSDMILWDRISDLYNFNGRVINYNQLDLKLPDGRPFEGEPSVLNFGGFFVWNSSARIYVKRLWGQKYLVDDKIAPEVEKKVDFYVSSFAQLQAIGQLQEKDVRSTTPYAGRFMTLPGVGDAACANILKMIGLREAPRSISVSPSAAVLNLQPAGFFQIEHIAGKIGSSVPNIPIVLFTRDLRNCLVKVVSEILHHDYGANVSAFIQTLRNLQDNQKRMMYFLAQAGSVFMQSTYSENTVKWLFRPGVFRVRMDEIASVQSASMQPEMLVGLARHLNLPVGDGARLLSMETLANEGELLKAFWNEEVESLFVELGGERIQAFYDFHIGKNEDISRNIGKWRMSNGNMLHIFPHGVVHANNGMTGRVLTDGNGRLILDWNASDYVDFLTSSSDRPGHLRGWNNFGHLVSGDRF